ncbi:titin-like, partial [Armigeres subalbatus]|uniref:titin-like n=1 Tax=Armigeres subalbatus TaxID=124917 RepID=UPI002ED26753
MLDEMAVEFLKSPTRETRELPLGIASISSLPSILAQVTNLEPSETTSSSASIDIVPQRSMITEETLVSERETDSIVLDSSKLSNVPKYNLIGLNESVQVSEVLTEELPQETTHVKPTTHSAKAELIPTQSLQISESITHDSISDLQTHTELPLSAKIELFTHDAKIVQETISNLSEESLTLPQTPMSSKAHATVLSKESIEISEVNKIEKEQDLDSRIKLPSVTPKYHILPSESIQTSETIAEDSPSKFYPELAVPTESARKVFIEQKSYTTHVLNAPEKEDIYVPGRLPPQQTADILLSTTESLQIAEQPSQEHESELSAEPKPASYKAIDSVTTLEGLTTETVNEAYSTRPFETETFETRTATVDFREQTTVSISKIISNETESDLAPFMLAPSAKASTTLSTLSIGESVEPFVHEKETLHQGVPRPYEATAESILEPIENIAVTEIETADTAGRFSPEAMERTEMATAAFTLQQSHSVSAVLTNEKEAAFVGRTDQKLAYASPQLNVQHQLEVTTHEVNERETSFNTSQMPADQLARAVPTDMLKSVLIQETTTNLSTTDMPHTTHETSAAQVRTDELEVKTIAETTVYEGTQEYQKPVPPEQKTVDTTLQPNTELIVTEVVTEQREREGFDAQELAKDYAAKPVPTHSLKSVLVQETLVSDSVDQVPQALQMTTSAVVKDDRFEETVVSEAMVLEGTEQYAAPEIPALKSGHTKTEPLEGLVVTEVITEVREQEGVKAEDIAKDYVAKTSASEALKSVLIEEVQISNITGELTKPDIQTSAATINRDELEQTTVMQALILEGLNKLLEDTTPEMRTAETALSPKRELTITEVFPEQKEREGFDIQEIAKDYVAKQTPSHTLSLVVVETTEATDSVGNVSTLQMMKSSATVKSDQFEEKIVSETMVFEEASKHEEQEFNTKQAEPSLVPITELVVTEVVAEQREKEGYDVHDIAKDYKASVLPSHALKSVMVQEVLTSDTVDRVVEEAVQSSAAMVRSDQLEQKTISETIAYEGVAQVPEDVKPAQRTADSVYQLISEVLVTEVSPEERERDGFSATEIAKDYVAKTVPSDTLKSITVEQVVPTEGFGKLDNFEAGTTTALLRNDQHEQTIVQETMIYEDAERYIESSKPTEKSAEPVVTPITELIITEVHPEQKEREGYDVAELAKENIVKAVPSHTLKSVTVEEVLLSEKEEQLAKTKTITSTAALKNDELEQKTVSETIVYEGSQLLPADEQPSVKKASPAYQPNTEIIVTEVIPEQKEREGFNIEELAKDHIAMAIPSHTLKSVQVQETISSENVDDFTKESTATSSAIFKEDKFDETSVQETVVLESIAKYDEQAKPDEKTADTLVTTISELIVTEVVTEQKEKEGYSVDEIAKDHVAKVVPSDALKSISVQEVQTADVLGRILDTSMDTKTAIMTKEELEQTTTSETYIFEGLRQYNEDKPLGKVAAPNVEAINELLVTEVIAEQKEKEGYDVKDIASNYVAKEIPSHTLRSIQVEQVQLSDDVGHIPSQETQKSHAKTIDSEIEQKIISENVVLESTDTIIEQVQPEQKSAEANIQPITELVITEVVAEQKEKEGYNVQDIASQYVAKSIPAHSLKSIQVEEVITSSATGDIISDDRSLSSAQIREDEHEQTTITQQVVLENLELLEKSVQPEQKAAIPSMQPNEELIVTEIISEQKETEGYNVEEISKNYSAKQIPIDTLKSITVEEIQLADAVGSIQVPETISTTASVRKNEFEETIISETLVYEELGKQLEKIVPEQKTADSSLLPNTELVVTEVVTEQKEKEGFDVHDIAKDYSAKPVTDGLMRSLIIEEVQTTDHLGDVAQITEKQLATIKKDQFEQTTEAETMVYEAIDEVKESSKPDSKTAELLIQPNAEIIVTEVVSEQREKEGYDIKEIAKDYVAKAMPAKTMKSVTVEQVEVTEDISRMEKLDYTKQSAILSKDTLEQTVVTETLAFENITQQEQTSLPEQKKAESTLESMTGVTITEVVTEQKVNEGILSAAVDQQKAKLVPTDVLKSLTVEQIEPLLDATDVTSVESRLSKASVKTDELSVTSVTETTAFEGIKEHEGRIEFDWHTAKLVPADVFKCLSIEQVEPFLLTGNVPEEMLKPLSVVIRTDEQEQVVASETTVFECIKDFLEKTEHLEQFAKPMVGDILKSLTVEQVVSLQHTGDVEKFIAKATSALIKSDEREQTTVAESVIYEALKEYFGKLEIESQTAKLIPSDVLKSITIEQVQPLDELHEVTADTKSVSQAVSKTDELEEVVTTEATVYEGLKAYDETLSLDEHLAKKVLSSEHKSVSVEQVETYIGIGKVKTEISSISEAVVKPDEFEQKVISETIVYEGIHEGSVRVPADERHATPAVDGLKLPVKSEVDTADAAEDLTAQLKTQEDSATRVVVEQVVASQTQTLTHDSLGQLKASEEIDTKHAIPQYTDLHVPSQLETVPSEALEQLKQPLNALESTATVNISKFIVPLQSHTISADTTAPFEEITEPRKFATKAIQDGLRAAECIEVSSNELNDISVPTEAPHGQASVSFTTNIIANVMETNTHENVDNITVHMEPTKRFAQLTQSMFDTMYEESSPVIREDHTATTMNQTRTDTQALHDDKTEHTTHQMQEDTTQVHHTIRRQSLHLTHEGQTEETCANITIQMKRKTAKRDVENDGIIEKYTPDATVTEVITEDESKKQITKKRVIKKKAGQKMQITEIVTVQEDDQLPQTTVTVTESELPFEEATEFKPATVEPQEAIVQELPEEIKVIEVITEEGKPKKQITKKRVIKKKAGKKEQVTEIVTVQEDDQLPLTTVTVTESELPFEEATEFKPATIEPQEAIVQELPEEIKVTEVITEEGKPKKQITKKRVIKKKSGKKEQVTEIVTVQEDDQLPLTTVTVTESELPFEEVSEFKPATVEPQEAIVQELPEEIKVTEVITEEGKLKKQITKKRVIKKKAGKKEQVTEIVTVQEDDQLPLTTVTVIESELPFEEATEFKPATVEPQEAIVQELPEEIKVTEVITKEGKLKKQITKKRVIKKKAGKKEQVTEIVTVQEDDQLPLTTVTVTESELPFEEVSEFKPAIVEPQEAFVQELPEEIKVTEVITEEGKPKKQIIKKRVIKKKAGKKEQVTEIVTVQEDDQLPLTTVTVTESELPFEEVSEFKPATVEPQEAIVQELPEEIKVTEVITEEGKLKKQITKKRVIKKKAGKKEQVTEIVTVQEDDQLPLTTVTVIESELPFEEATEFKPATVEPQEAIVQELPEEIKVTEVITKEGKLKKQITKKRVIKKKAGKKEQVTEIVTVQEDDQLPLTTVTVTESELPFEEVPEFKPAAIEPQEAIVQELPEEIKVTEAITEEGKPKKQITKKRVIKKKAGKKEHVTEIVTVQEDDQLPQTTVTVTESELPFEEVSEFKPAIVEPQEAIVQELPEEIKVTKVITEEGKLKKQITKKRVIKKKAGKKEHVTEIVTVQEDDQLPQTTVTVTESEFPFEEVSEFKPAIVEPQEAIVQELPEEIKVTEVITEEGKPKKQITKKRVIKKKAGKKEQVTEIVTVQEDDQLPQTTVTVTESELPFEEATEFKPATIEPQEAIVQELPEEIKVTEVITEKGKPKKQITKKRVIKKKSGKKEQVTEIVTVQEDDQLPQTTVTVTESELPFEETTELKPATIEPQEAIVQELPEEIKVTEVITEKGKPKKQITKKRVIKKKSGKKEQVTEIVTVQEDDQLPLTTVTVTESELPFEEATEFKPATVEPQEAIVQELPEEIKVTEVITEEGKPKKQIIKKRVIKKKAGKKEQVTEIVTVQEDDQLPLTTVTVTESELPFEEATEFKPATVEPQEAIVQELPEEIKVTEVITEEGKPKKQIIKKRVIKKKAGKKEQVTEIVTVQEDDQLPSTTVTVTESELPFEEATEFKPATVEPQEAIVQELPEEIKVTEVITEEGKPKKQIIKKRVIKKKAGKKEQVTEIVTVQEDDQLPQTTVTVTESELPFEEVSEFKPATVEPQEAIVQELPEEIKVTEVITEEGKPKKQIIKKRVIKKKAGKKEQVTEIVTVQEDDQLPLTTVTVTESELPFEEVSEFKPAAIEPQEAIVQELPEEIKVTEVITEEGKPKKQIIKKRVIKKKAGKKEQVTEIVTVQEDDQLPLTTVTVTESELPFEEATEFKPATVEPQEAIVQELPEEIKVTEVITEEGKPKKQIIKKRVIKKKAGKKEQVTEIVTVQEDDQLPQTTVTVTESELPFEEVSEFKPATVEPQEAIVQELPEEIKVTEIITEEGKPVKQIINKRVIKKKAGKKEQVTEIVTVQEDDQLPLTTVTVTESELPFEEAIELKPATVEPQEAIVQELPEEIKVTEIITEEGKPKKQITKKRVIKKKSGKKEQVTEIVTVQEDDQLPLTTVTVTESELPFEEVSEFKPATVEPQEAIVQELPEEVKVTEVITEEGKPKKQIIKKRVIKKKAGKKEQVTEIVTVQEDDQLPLTTVTVTESELPFEEATEFKPATVEPQEAIVQELPEEVKVTEVITEEGKPKKQIIKKRVIKKKAGKKEQVTEIVTVQEDDQLPLTTVTVTESELPFEEATEFKPATVEPQEAIVQELPEEIKVTEVITEEGKPVKQIIKKRVIKKKAGKKEQVTEIVTVQEDDQLPLTTVTVTESELPFEEAIELKPATVEPQEAIVQELPEEIKVTEIITEEGKPKKQITKKRVIKKKSGKKEQVTEIVTVQEDDQLPLTTVTVTESELPFEEVSEFKPATVEPQEAIVQELPEEVK